MDQFFEDVLLSRPVTFVVGPNQKEYIVHEKIISKLSKPLSRLLTGDMKEARECRVVWDDIEEQTFVRFSRWAYAGDYEADTLGIRLDISSTAKGIYGDNSEDSGYCDDSEDSDYCDDSEDNEDDDDCNDCDDGTESIAKPYSLRTLYYEMEKTAGLEPSKRFEMVEAFMQLFDWPLTKSFYPRVNSDPSEDFTNVFLSHAQLYVLGDKYDIGALCHLASYKLNETLKCFLIHAGNMGSILALVEYVFENTRSDDKIRSLLVHYMACIAEDLVKEADFQSFVVTQPEAVSALMAKMIDRLA